MSDNDKNVLQIYCQRAKLSLPTYKHSRDSAGLWVSSVTFSYNNKNVTFVGDGCDRKSQSDISAASVALRSLGLGPSDSATATGQQHDESIVICNQAHTWSDFCQTAKISTAPGSKITMYVLIDYENINSLQMLNHVYEDAHGNKVEILKFLSYNHHMVENGTASHIVHSAGGDSVDHAISMYVGMLLAYQADSPCKPSLIIVLTGDKFGERLQNMTQWTAPGKTIDSVVVHLRTEASCVETLDSFGYKQTDVRMRYVKAK